MRSFIISLIFIIITSITCFSGDLQKYTLENAKTFVGVSEKTGNNDGPEVEKILGYVGLPKGNPYCLATVVYCYHLGALQVSSKDKLPKYARVSMMWNYANSNPFRYKIINKQSLMMGTNKLDQADISIHNRSGGTASNFNGHAGLVIEQDTKETFKSIEGNTGPGKDQGEGEGIYIKRRFISKMNGNLGLKGFIRIKE